MRSVKKKRRIQMLVFGGLLLIGASALFGFLAQDAIAFFKSPSELRAQTFREDQLLRVGGLVVDGSARQEGAEHRFDVTDGGETVEVRFAGILPDLFREGQGIVAQGYWRNGIFTATEVLAKHDENYLPKEVADALREQGHFREAAE
ncbi:MAG: cytochrome c maturation protein CcmE [Pseudomonadota bacterium]